MNPTRKTPLGVGRIWLYVLALGLLIVGLFLVIGGGILIARGGSWYFLIAGIVITASAIEVVRGRSAGTWLFLAAFAGTAVWALFDVGLDYWGLISRLLAMTFLAAVVCSTLPLLRKAEGSLVSGKPGVIAGVILGVIGLMGFGSMFVSHPDVVATGPATQRVPVAPGQEQKNWVHYGNDAGHGRFAALDQINVDNVAQLEQAWVFQTGDIPQSTGSGAEDQLTPMQIGEKLFLCTPRNNVIALDVDRGEQLWRRDFNTSVGGVWERCRGLAYFDVNAPLIQPTVPGSTPVTPVSLPTDGQCQRRVLMNTIDARLVAINADTGEMCEEFGDNGIVDLKANIGGIANEAYYTMTAVDLKTQEIAWQVPVGTVQDTGPMGIKMTLPFEVGMPTLGPSLATQGGLLFFAGTQDYYLRAFDTSNGKEVWKQRMPVGSQGGPITYKSPNTGKQYVVISAGGARQSPDRGDYVIAYALPD